MARKIEDVGRIYKITAPTGSIYIGQTTAFAGRVCDYKSGRCNKQKRLYNSLQKYGYDKHIIEVIEELPKDLSVLNAREIYWIAYYKCNYKRYPEHDGLNLNDGGGVVESLSGQEHYEYISDIYQIELKTKQCIGVYPTGNFAARKNGFICSKINEVLRGVRNTAYGCYWTRNLNEWEAEYQVIYNRSQGKKVKVHESFSHIVSAYSPDGSLYKTFPSLSEAAKHFDITDIRGIKSNIAHNSNKENKRKLLWGHTWKYGKD